MLSTRSVAISLHRQPMLRFPKTAERCLTAFEARSTILNDKRLVAWLRLQLLAEEVETIKAELLLRKGQADSNGPSSLHDLREQFDCWERSLTPGVMNGTLDLVNRNVLS